MSELVPGGNVPLPSGTLTLRVPGPFDVSALITDDGGKVRGDGDFVFYNQPGAPGVRLTGEGLTVDPAGLRPGASRVCLVVGAADPDTPLGRLPVPVLHVSGPGGRALVRFAPPRPDSESVLLIAEIYRRGTGWKLRALGQGYADGLAGVARDFGIEVIDETPAEPARRAPEAPRPAPLGTTPAMPAPPRPAPGVVPPRPAGRSPGGDPRVHQGPDEFLARVNAARAAAGAPPVFNEARLTAAAQAHAAAMAATGRLGAETLDGVSVHQRLTATGYAYLTVGEHLVSGPRTPAEFVEYCLSTERSRLTLCAPAFGQVGVGHAAAPRSGDLFWTALWACPFSPAGLARTAAEVLALTNAERTSAGLRPLAADARLTEAAQAHSTDMAVRGFYSHTSPEGREPWDRAAAAGSGHRSVGENIACGQRFPTEVVRGWMNSPGHRANILKPAFTHLGVGFAGGGPAGTYWTQLFGG
ncbi:CAP domain-containing protein [Streptomyces sp. NPDC005481]|uniref:CAP domain-containing protein n=1 Tax=Streptomyces sp. NPDC005481 TaxID=3154881 RepID=UPI0033B6CD2E